MIEIPGNLDTLRGVLKKELNEMHRRYSQNLVSESKIDEVRDARGGEPRLNDRFTRVEQRADQVRNELDTIVASDGTSNNEVVASRISPRDSTNHSSLSSRLLSDYWHLSDTKLNKDESIFNAVLLCGPGSLHIDFEDQKVVTANLTGGINVNNAYRVFKEGEFSFSSASGSALYLVFHVASQDILILPRDEATALNRRENGIFGVLRRDHKTVYIEGTTYTTSHPEWGDQKHVYNSSLMTPKGSFIIDFTDNTLKVGAAGGRNINVNRKEYIFNTAEYSFDDEPANSLFIAFDTVNSEFTFLRNQDMQTINYNRYGVVGAIRSNDQQAFVNGAAYEVKVPQSSNYIDNFGFIPVGDNGEDYETEHSYTALASETDVYELYDRYDDLMEANPQYITKGQIATTPGNRPIYCYDFQMPTVQDAGYNLPKFYISGLVHGHENETASAALAFFTELCNEWTTNKTLLLLRGNAHIIFVPVTNPDGYVANERKNGNGVDIGRNFPEGWQSNNDPEDWYYSGPSAGSEIETQAIMDLLEDNPDIAYALDFHVDGTLAQTDKIARLGVANTNPSADFTKYLITSFGQHFNTKWRAQFPSLADYSDSLVRLSPSTVGGGLNTYWDSLGIRGLLIEGTTGFETDDTDTQVVNTEILGNLILTAIRQTYK